MNNNRKRSTDWHIPFSSLHPYKNWVDLEWPAATDKETLAWSGFCGLIEHFQRYKQKIALSTLSLTEKQLKDAIADILDRGWVVKHENNMLEISEPTK